MDKAMHLLAMELNLKKGSMDLMVANTVFERKTRAAMQHEAQTEGLQKIGILPTTQLTQGGEAKEDAYKKSGEPTGKCAGFSDKER